MSVKIFRDDNWSRIKNGLISRRDIMELDPEKDRELIRYLIAHASKQSRRSMMKYASEKYGIDELPEPLINIDDPEDKFFWEYTVLREQITQEDDREVLMAALQSSDRDIAAFAFCRLTGFSRPLIECDAYSYRTFNCDILPGTADEKIVGICRSIIEEEGLLKDMAIDCLRYQKAGL